MGRRVEEDAKHAKQALAREARDREIRGMGKFWNALTESHYDDQLYCNDTENLKKRLSKPTRPQLTRSVSDPTRCLASAEPDLLETFTAAASEFVGMTIFVV